MVEQALDSTAQFKKFDLNNSKVPKVCFEFLDLLMAEVKSTWKRSDGLCKIYLYAFDLNSQRPPVMWVRDVLKVRIAHRETAYLNTLLAKSVTHVL